MKKYEVEEDEKTVSRSSRNADLYEKDEIDDYNKIDINSNVSVLKTDVREIDVDKIRDMLDKKYRDNMPQRRSINIETDEETEPDANKDATKEYDINEIIAKAKSAQDVDYDKERLRKLRDTNYTILDNLNLKRDEEPEEDIEVEAPEPTNEKELRELISTITSLEAENEKKVIKDLKDNEGDLLNLTDENDSVTLPPSEENSFYTGNLAVKEEDYDSFDDLQDDIKSNSVIIKILVLVFIVIIFGVVIYLLNYFLNWELFLI